MAEDHSSTAASGAASGEVLDKELATWFSLYYMLENPQKFNHIARWVMPDEHGNMSEAGRWVFRVYQPDSPRRREFDSITPAPVEPLSYEWLESYFLYATEPMDFFDPTDLFRPKNLQVVMHTRPVKVVQKKKKDQITELSLQEVSRKPCKEAPASSRRMKTLSRLFPSDEHKKRRRSIGGEVEKSVETDKEAPGLAEVQDPALVLEALYESLLRPAQFAHLCHWLSPSMIANDYLIAKDKDACNLGNIFRIMNVAGQEVKGALVLVVKNSEKQTRVCLTKKFLQEYFTQVKGSKTLWYDSRKLFRPDNFTSVSDLVAARQSNSTAPTAHSDTKEDKERIKGDKEREKERVKEEKEKKAKEAKDAEHERAKQNKQKKEGKNEGKSGKINLKLGPLRKSNLSRKTPRTMSQFPSNENRPLIDLEVIQSQQVDSDFDVLRNLHAALCSNNGKGVDGFCRWVDADEAWKDAAMAGDADAMASSCIFYLSKKAGSGRVMEDTSSNVSRKLSGSGGGVTDSNDTSYNSIIYEWLQSFFTQVEGSDTHWYDSTGLFRKDNPKAAQQIVTSVHRTRNATSPHQEGAATSPKLTPFDPVSPPTAPLTERGMRKLSVDGVDIQLLGALHSALNNPGKYAHACHWLSDSMVANDSHVAKDKDAKAHGNVFRVLDSRAAANKEILICITSGMPVKATISRSWLKKYFISVKDSGELWYDPTMSFSETNPKAAMDLMQALAAARSTSSRRKSLMSSASFSSSGTGNTTAAAAQSRPLTARSTKSRFSMFGSSDKMEKGKGDAIKTPISPETACTRSPSPLSALDEPLSDRAQEAFGLPPSKSSALSNLSSSTSLSTSDHSSSSSPTHCESPVHSSPISVTIALAPGEGTCLACGFVRCPSYMDSADDSDACATCGCELAMHTGGVLKGETRNQKMLRSKSEGGSASSIAQTQKTRSTIATPPPKSP